MDGTPDLNLLKVFLAVAEVKSFSAAARRLGLPKSSVSRAVARLEASLGVELFHRTTHRVVTSEAGLALLGQVAAPLQTLAQAAVGLPGQEAQPSGVLKVTAPADVGVALLPELVASYCARYPTVRVEAVVTNRLVDLVGEGVDLALRAFYRPLRDSAMHFRRLGAIEMQWYAAPAYLAQRGAPRRPGEEPHRWIRYGGQAFARTAGTPRLEAVAVGDDFFYLRGLVRAGVGVGLLPGFLAAPEVSAGALVKVMPDQGVKAATLGLLLPRSRLPRPAVTAFRDHLLEEVPRLLAGAGSRRG